METRKYIRVYRKVKPFVSNLVVFPEGSVYEMNDHPNHPSYGVCMFCDTCENVYPDKWGKLYRDLTQLPVTVQEQIRKMVEFKPSFMAKG